MSCYQLHFDVAIVDSHSVESEPQNITLLKTAVLHLMHEDPCGAPLDICVQRVVKCQNGCTISTFLHDFPIDACDPILPPGEYQISVGSKMTMLVNAVVGIDVIFEEVSPEYVQAIIANKAGGC